MRGLWIILIFLAYTKGFSQKIPAFKPVRYDEDYSFLKNDTPLHGYKRIKYLPLSSDRKSYISFGGEARLQYLYVKNENWGDASSNGDGYILHRYLFHTDLHAGKNFRSFIQLQSSLSVSRIDPSPVDKNPLELQQAFIDVQKNPLRQSKLIFRVGRQELLYGSQRLVAVRDGPNNRQSFDAIKSMATVGHYKADLFYSHSVAARKGIFDDKFNKNTKLWGAYIVRNQLPLIKNVDLYYLGLWKRNTLFNDGAGKELRHSIGSRLWGKNSNWQYDAEGGYQFGSFAGKHISAWSVSLNVSYQFIKAKWKPEVGFKTELISGDKIKGDNKLQTLNPLFPRGAYFGLAALIGPANLVDIHPSVSLSISDQLNLDMDYDVFWRHSRYDGIYTVNTMLIYPDANTPEKYIGSQMSGSVNYRLSNFLIFRGGFTWFDAGDYLRMAGTGKDIIFTVISTQIKL